MKRLVFRILAFVLDIVLVSLVIFGLSNISILNPNISKINDEYAKISQTQGKYIEFKDKIDDFTEDSRISPEEYKTIEVDYPEYKVLFEEIVVGEDLTNEFTDNLPAEVDKEFQNVLTDYNYEIQKLSIYENIIAIVVYVLYFGVLAYVMKGQTVFKKIFRLKTIDKDDENKKITLWNYLVRSVIITEIVLLAIDMICVMTLKESAYVTASYWISQVKYIYEMAFIIVLIMRDDQRSIHDLLLNTKVVRYDKEGKIIEEQMFITSENVPEEEKVIEKKKKKKEIVKAEKVDD